MLSVLVTEILNLPMYFSKKQVKFVSVKFHFSTKILIFLADFGVAHKIKGERDKLKTMAGSPYWFAPE